MARTPALFILIALAFLVSLQPTVAQGAVPEIPGNLRVIPEMDQMAEVESLRSEIPMGTPGFRITWDPVQGESVTYEIPWGTDRSVSETNHSGILSTAATNYFHSGMVDGSDYCYTIKACSQSGCSLLSEIVCETFLDGPPFVQAPSTDCDGSYNVGISSIAFSYSDRNISLQRAVDPSFKNPVALPAGYIVPWFYGYSETDLTSGTYYYRARADKNGLVSAWTLATTVIVTHNDPLAAPEAITYPPTADGKFTVSWSPVDAAEGYELQSGKEATFTLPYTAYRLAPYETSKDFFKMSGTYYFRVAALNDCGKGAWKAGGPIVVKNGPRSSVYGRLHQGSAKGPALVGATVTCGGNSTQTQSPDGYFHLSGIPEGEQELRFSKTGYKPYSTPIEFGPESNFDVGDRYLTKITTKPTVTQFKINDGAAGTKSRTVTLTNTATGNPADYMASEFSDFNGGAWLPYSPSPTFELKTAGNGTKTVYFKLRNAAGQSAVKSDTIELNEPTKGGVHGALHDGAADGPPLRGASVTCGGKSVKTLEDGSYNLSGIALGPQTLSFSKSGYQPYSRDVTIVAGQNPDLGNDFLVGLSIVRTVIMPQAAVSAGAQWKLDDGSWRASGESAKNVSAGVHTVTYKDISRWVTPAPKEISVKASETVEVSANYIKQYKLTVNLVPPEAGSYTINGRSYPSGYQGYFDPNASVLITTTATLDSGYFFQYYDVDGETDSCKTPKTGTQNISAKMDSNKSLTIHYIDHLISTSWDQGYPYTVFINPNTNICISNPVLFKEGDYQYVVGCTAVAVAQLINYYISDPQYSNGWLDVMLQGITLYPRFDDVLKKCDNYQGYVTANPKPCYAYTNSIGSRNQLNEPANSQTSRLIRFLWNVSIGLDTDFGKWTTPESGFSPYPDETIGQYEKMSQILHGRFRLGDNITFSNVLHRFDSEAEYIKHSIESGNPVLAFVYRTGGAHCLLIDGYRYVNDVFQVHINLGWGSAVNDINQPYNNWYDGTGPLNIRVNAQYNRVYDTMVIFKNTIPE